MKILGIDYGDKRVGTALSDALGITAQGYKTLENTGGKKLFLGLKEIIDENEVKTIVIGLPKNMDASEGFRVDATKEFAERLKKREAIASLLFSVICFFLRQNLL